MSQERGETPKKRIVDEEGELTLIELPDYMDHETAVQNQEQTIKEKQKQITQAMRHHMAKLDKTDKEGDLFYRPRLGQKYWLISRQTVTRQDDAIKRDGHLLVGDYGFYFFYTDDSLENYLKSNLTTLVRIPDNKYAFRTERPLGIGNYDVELNMSRINLEEANIIVNELIAKKLKAQEDERLSNAYKISGLEKTAHDLSDNELDIPEIPNYAPETKKRRISFPPFLKKKKN
jgi:hypothetical protein